jgi:hypothetical protein
MSRYSSDGPQVPRSRNRRNVLLYCNLGSKVARIRAAPDKQQDVRDSVVKACWSGEVGKVAAQLSLGCLLMYNFRVDDHTSKNVKVDDPVHLLAGTFILRYRWQHAFARVWAAMVILAERTAALTRGDGAGGLQRDLTTAPLTGETPSRRFV